MSDENHHSRKSSPSASNKLLIKLKSLKLKSFKPNIGLAVICVAVVVFFVYPPSRPEFLYVLLPIAIGWVAGK
jgi:hypothetical protein